MVPAKLKRTFKTKGGQNYETNPARRAAEANFRMQELQSGDMRRILACLILVSFTAVEIGAKPPVRAKHAMVAAQEAWPPMSASLF